MAELIAKAALDGQGALARAGLVLSVLPPERVWSIAPWPGADLRPLLAPLGLSFPAPGAVSIADDLRLVWTGRDQAFLFGVTPPEGLADLAAVTDQSGAWAGLSLEGANAAEALARLVSTDLRLQSFPAGHVIRSGLNHIPAIIWRRTATAFAIFVFRSMARSAWHELAEVLDHMQARAGGAVAGGAGAAG